MTDVLDRTQRPRPSRLHGHIAESNFSPAFAPTRSKLLESYQLSAFSAPG
jgi:hypothetical protein